MTGPEFAAARLSLGLTQVQLAERMGYHSQPAIARIERVRPNPQAARLMEAYLSGYRPIGWYSAATLAEKRKATP